MLWSQLQCIQIVGGEGPCTSIRAAQKKENLTSAGSDSRVSVECNTWWSCLKDVSVVDSVDDVSAELFSTSLSSIESFLAIISTATAAGVVGLCTFTARLSVATGHNYAKFRQ